MESVGLAAAATTDRRRTTPAAPPLAAAGAFAVMAAAQIAYPLASGARVALSSITVVALAATSLALLAAAWGAVRAVLALVLVAGGALAVEAAGIRSGFPFGSYRYGGALQPEVLGVPAIVPLAWFGMGVPAHAVATRVARSGWGRVATGAAALAAWDLFLDPQMLREGYWTWSAGGPYRDIPLSNFAGWLVASALLMALLDRLEPPSAASGPPVHALLGLYAWTWVMETIGFVVFFGDPLVGAAGGVAMGVPALAGLRTLRGSGGAVDREPLDG